MAVLSFANLKKTLFYLRRNGVKNTWNAARERMERAGSGRYEWAEPSLTELLAGREYSRELIAEAEENGAMAPTFSILVPAYRTDPGFLKELAESVMAQTYPCWELLILDASENGAVRDALREICAVKGIPYTEEDQDGGLFCPGSVRFVKLSENRGISENTNAGIGLAKGSYMGLLDHDDVLTPDALQCMAEKILQSGGQPEGRARLLYSDEDKWSGEEKGYYEPNFKEDFNLDLLLSNNYICHFLVLEAGLMRELRLRREYDGAQDYDLVLRAVERLGGEGIVHIPRVLYHWRCHRGSTAENPRSKTYAYEAGRRALQDYADRQGIPARAVHLKHVGFYRLEYGGGSADDAEETAQVSPGRILERRPDLGAVGGRISAGRNYRQTPEEKRKYPDAGIRRGCLVGGRMDREGTVLYYGLKPGYSGYLHRAALTQDAEAVDLRCICVAEEFRRLFEEVLGVPYVTRPGGEWFDSAALPAGADIRRLSLAFCEALRLQGKRILWDPRAQSRTE